MTLVPLKYHIYLSLNPMHSKPADVLSRHAPQKALCVEPVQRALAKRAHVVTRLTGAGV